jgi:hypothetical protein
MSYQGLELEEGVGVSQEGGHVEDVVFGGPVETVVDGVVVEGEVGGYFF